MRQSLKRIISTRPSWIERLRDILIPEEPPVPDLILTPGHLRRFTDVKRGALVCIKVSAAYELPYPFSVSSRFVAKLVTEIHRANPLVRIVLTEGGVGNLPVKSAAERSGLTTVPHCEFVDSEEDGMPAYLPNPRNDPLRFAGFCVSRSWADADVRVLLTTCKLRSHHFRRWYSGGCRNLIGLLPRSEYRLPGSRRDMRSSLHQKGATGMDAMVADLYATAGRDVLTILDARLLARQDEHIPLRFTRRADWIVVANDPSAADLEMVQLLKLPFIPPYLSLIGNRSLASDQSMQVGDVSAFPTLNST